MPALLLAALLGLPLTAPPAAAAPKALFAPQGQALLDKALRDLYDLDYPEADAGFRRIVSLEPDNPFSYMVEAASLWWQAADESSLRQVSASREALFETDVSAALDKTNPLLRSADPGLQAQGHFIAGMVLGARGQWEMLKHHWLKAYLDGKKAVKHLNACVRIDSDYDDAYLGLGAYDYQVAHYKKILRLGFLFGARGDEERGIGLIKLALEKGSVSSEQAGLFLITAYIMDRHDYAQALPLIRQLGTRFPDSLYFQVLESVLDYNLGNDADSLSLAKNAFFQISKDPQGFQRKLPTLACGIAQKQCFSRDYAEKAAGWFDMAIASRTAATDELEPRQWLTFAQLYRGYAEDILGQRPSAIADYQWALGHADFLDAHKQARGCLEKFCRARELSDYLKGLASKPSAIP